MSQISRITPGIITSCNHKRELHKELQINNNATLHHIIEITKMLSMVVRKAKIIKHDKLILNSHNKVKTTWDIINKESGRNKKKKSEIQALNIEGKKKITDQQTIAETFNEYFVAIEENVKIQRKIILLMMITVVWIIILISWNKLLINLTQTWKVNAHQQKKLNKL